ncbi:hypothetical protein BAOM_3063 [Peribacillus asahii]|uniref:Uncharacterized protein n=1 Tax=Peribacillus asahii TaxID=228899 RepID=A0A3T0KT93_9BACI|nr:hypothetical protein [Peribacillus asahii]AZV43672.1 hypothetical protein BAOM_3063 [Peribacillus asahii]
MSKIQEIKDESLHDGKGVIVHIDNFKWLIEQAEKVEQYKEQLTELICTIYEHANEGTALMDLAERIDEME